MKKTITLLLALLCVIALQAQNQKAKKFAVKSGYIEYKLGENATGTKKLWWDDFGKKTRTEEDSKTVTKMFGITDTKIVKSTTIMDGPNYWVVDQVKNDAQKGTTPYYQEGQEMTEDMTEEELKKLSDDILTQMGGQRLPNENYQGYDCEVLELMGTRSWIYKGITLKIKGEIMGVKSLEEMVKFDPGKSVSSSMFKPDPNIEYQDMNKMMQQMMPTFEEEDED